MPIIEVNGQELEFPDDMSDDDIKAVLRKKFPAQTQPKKSISDVALTGALQGATFGLADEMISRAGAAIDPNLTYEEIMQAAQEDISQGRKDRPGVALASEIGGGLATGLAGGLTKAGRALASSLGRGGLAARTVKGGAIGAASGAAYGAGTAQPGERLEGAQRGGIAGGAIGAAIPIAGAAISGLAGGTKNLVTGALARDVDALGAVEGKIKSGSSAAYQKMRDIGATFTNPGRFQILRKINKDLLADGPLNAGLHGNTVSVVNDIKKAMVETPDFGLEHLDQYRRLLSRIPKTNPEDARKAAIAIDAIDDAVDKLGGASFSKGGKEAVDALNIARSEWSRGKKFEAISNLVESSNGDANFLKRELTKFVENPKKTRGFTPDEMIALKNAAKQSGGEGILKMLGKFGFDLGSSRAMGTTALPTLGSALAGFGAGGAPGALALPAVGTAARQAQKWVARGKVEGLLKVIEGGGKITQKQLSTLPPQDAINLIKIMQQSALPQQAVRTMEGANGNPVR